MRTLLVLASAVLLLLAPATGQAQGQAATAQARRHFETATQAFDTGDYALAVDEFQAAYAITHHPDLLFNIYSSAERAGRIQEAADALERFLSEGQVEAARRPALEQRLARLRQRLATGQETAEHETPAQEPEPEHRETEEHRPEPAPRPSGVHPAGIGVLITAGVLAAAFVGLAIGSEVEDSRLASTCGRETGMTCSESETSTLMALNIAADVSWIAAAVAGVVGIVLLVALPPEGGAQTERAMLAPWVTRDSGGLALLGSF